MRLPRLTTRRLMVIVAVAAMLLGTWHEMRCRAAHYREIANGHLQEIGRGSLTLPEPAWHLEMAEKYERAARYPWLPVPPDPPEPK